MSKAKAQEEIQDLEEVEEVESLSIKDNETIVIGYVEQGVVTADEAGTQKSFWVRLQLPLNSKDLSGLSQERQDVLVSRAMERACEIVSRAIAQQEEKLQFIPEQHEF